MKEAGGLRPPASLRSSPSPPLTAVSAAASHAERGKGVRPKASQSAKDFLIELPERGTSRVMRNHLARRREPFLSGTKAFHHPPEGDGTGRRRECCPDGARGAPPSTPFAPSGDAPSRTLGPCPRGHQRRPTHPTGERAGERRPPGRTHLPTCASRHLRRTAGAVRTHLPSTAHLPSRRTHLPSTAHLPWRAVPGGAGSGRCGGRYQGVLGRDDVRHSAGRAHTCPPDTCAAPQVR